MNTVAPAFYRSVFIRNIGILMSGTALAQALGIVLSPVLTRLYDPSAFGVVGIFATIAGVAIALSTLSYEMALILPKDDADAANLFALAVLISIITTVVSFGFVAAGGQRLSEALGVPELRAWLWFLPIVALSGGVYKVLNYWCVRRKQFTRLSISRVVKTMGTSGTQVTAGLAGLLASGLMIGYLIGQLLAVLVLSLQVWRSERSVLVRHLEVSKIKDMAIRYLDFPRFRAPNEFIYFLSDSMSIFVFALFFSPVVVGLYALAQKLLQVPMELVGDSLKQVIYPRANEAYLEGVDQLTALVGKATLILFAMVPLPVLALILYGPTLFAFAFGERWIEAGTYAQYLVLYVASSFVRIPVATAVLLLELQKFQLMFTIVRSAVMLGFIAVGAYLGSAQVAVGGYAVSGLLFNVAFILYTILYLKLKARA